MCNSPYQTSQAQGYSDIQKEMTKGARISSCTLAQKFDQRIQELQQKISEIELLKCHLSAGAVLDTDITLLRFAVGI